MMKRDLLKPLLYHYRGDFDIRVNYTDDGIIYYATNHKGDVLNLKTLEVDIYYDDCFTKNLDDLLDQVDIYIQKTKTSEMYK